MEVSSTILSLAIILFAILLAPVFSYKVGVPLVVVEIAIGIILGKSFLNMITPNPWLDFFSYFGLIYLLFLAGLEVEFGEIRKRFTPVFSIALASLLIPFTLGLFLGEYLGVNPFFMGTIFSTTSLGVVLPLTRELKQREEFVFLLLRSTVIVDIVSMFLLTVSVEVFLKTLNYLFIFSVFYVVALFMLPFFFGRFKIGQKVRMCCGSNPYFYFEVRFCFALIAILALLAEIIGFHAIIGAFVAGLIVSVITWRGSLLERNLTSFGYGFFIPFFFIMVGVNTNLVALVKNIENILIFLLVLLVGIFGKVFGVGLVSRIFNLTFKESFSLGFIKTARLSLILAGVEIGRNIGILNETFYSIFVLFSLFSVLIGPSIGKILLKKE
ncbi:MAG: hypothetical protein DRO36_01125 [Candidatus Hecatellales archaeon]|nr:MAG: hypothetical protein DRO36_01125 [Candidatus Hecatellales archaeon]